MPEIAAKPEACPMHGPDMPKPEPFPAGAVPQLKCYQVDPRAAPVIPGRRDRTWMDQTNDHYAYRCLYFTTFRTHVLMDNVTPRRANIEDDPKLQADYTEWGKSRAEFNKLLPDNDPATVAKKWQCGYFRGKALGGDAPFHVNKRRLKPVE